MMEDVDIFSKLRERGWKEKPRERFDIMGEYDGYGGKCSECIIVAPCPQDEGQIKGGNGMNAREVMQALLDGKTVMEKYPRMGKEYIRLKGDDIEYTVLGDWEDADFIPTICLKYASVKEDE